jgi:hypothetical protein
MKTGILVANLINFSWICFLLLLTSFLSLSIFFLNSLLISLLESEDSCFAFLIALDLLMIV